MSSQTSRQFMDRYFAAMSGTSKSPELVERFVADESLKAHIKMFEESFPHYDLDVNDMIVEGDKVAIRATFRGVQKGEFQGIAPTGRAVSVPLMLIYRIEGEKIAQFWMNADSLGLMQQLGAVPAVV